MARLHRVQLIIILCVIVAGLIAAGVFYTMSQFSSYIRSQEGEMNIIADLKAAQIAQWYQSQIQMVDHVASSAVSIGEDFDQPDAVDHLIQHAGLFPGLDGVCLYDRAGSLIAGSSERRAWPADVLKSVAARVVETRGIQFSDMFLDETRQENRIRMVFAAPILTEGIIPDVLGVLAVIEDPYKE